MKAFIKRSILWALVTLPYIGIGQGSCPSSCSSSSDCTDTSCDCKGQMHATLGCIGGGSVCCAHYQ